jgi:LysM repeat protein
VKAFAVKSSSKNDLARSPGWMKPPPIMEKKNLTPFPGGNPFIQPKLKIGQPNDKYEQEADRVADRIMSIPEPKGSLGTAGNRSPLIQLQTDECPESNEEGGIQRQVDSEEEPEKEEEEEPIQAKQVSNKSQPVPFGLQRQIQSMRGGGQPLSRSTRSFFEPRFGWGFGNVRVHTDSKAADAAKSFNAKAFTIGRDMVFGSGQYSTNTIHGKRLLAHELTHVVQQSAVSSSHSSRISRIPEDEIKDAGIPAGVPPVSEPETEKIPEETLDKTPCEGEDWELYVVQEGDDLKKIAKKHETTVDKIKECNDLQSDTVSPGQKLKIPYSVARLSTLFKDIVALLSGLICIIKNLPKFLKCLKLLKNTKYIPLISIIFNSIKDVPLSVWNIKKDYLRNSFKKIKKPPGGKETKREQYKFLSGFARAYIFEPGKDIQTVRFPVTGVVLHKPWVQRYGCFWVEKIKPSSAGGLMFKPIYYDTSSVGGSKVALHGLGGKVTGYSLDLPSHGCVHVDNVMIGHLYSYFKPLKPRSQECTMVAVRSI